MAETLRLPAAEYTPDVGDYPMAGAAMIKNVVPRTLQSYGPLPSPQPIYNALGSRCRGAAAFKDAAEAVRLFAGDATDLRLIKYGYTAWHNVSKMAGAYNAADQTWRFTYFNGDVLATNYTDPIQAFTLATSVRFDDLSGMAPRAKFLAVVKNAFVVLGFTSDPLNGEKPQRIWWSAAGNHRNWPAPGTTAAAEVQSGAVDLLGPAGVVQGLAADLIYADAIVFQEYAVRRMAYAGPPTTWAMLPVESAQGCLAPGSIAALGGIAYYWGQGGVRAFDGQGSLPIGLNKIDKTVYGEVDPSNLGRIIGVADAKNQMIVWAYPTSQATDGNPDRLLFYSPPLQRFSLADVTSETLAQMLSIGYTSDEIETLLGYPSIDSIPYPLSSDVWGNGHLALAIFDTDHKLNYLAGPALGAYIDTAEMQPMPGRRTLVRRARPLVDAGEGDENNISVRIAHRETSARVPPSWSDRSFRNARGVCPMRAAGRYFRAQTIIPAGASWTEANGVELDAVPLGER